MSTETAFIGGDTILGDYWTKRRYFDYIINKDNFSLCYGKQFQQLIFLDPAIAIGSVKSREQIDLDNHAINYLLEHMHELKAESLVFVTTCDALQPDANENTPLLEESEDTYTQNRIKLYQSINLNFGRVLNVHVPELAISDPAFSPLLYACDNPPEGEDTLPFDPEETHQYYFPERIMGDVERCIPMGIPSIIPAAPPLSTREVCEKLCPTLAARLSPPSEEKQEKQEYPKRTSIHSFHWLDPLDGYFVTKEDQIELLQFYFGENKIKF